MADADCNCARHHSSMMRLSGLTGGFSHCSHACGRLPPVANGTYGRPRAATESPGTEESACDYLQYERACANQGVQHCLQQSLVLRCLRLRTRRLMRPRTAGARSMILTTSAIAAASGTMTTESS